MRAEKTESKENRREREEEEKGKSWACFALMKICLPNASRHSKIERFTWPLATTQLHYCGRAKGIIIIVLMKRIKSLSFSPLSMGTAQVKVWPLWPSTKDQGNGHRIDALVSEEKSFASALFSWSRFFYFFLADSSNRGSRGACTSSATLFNKTSATGEGSKKKHRHLKWL